MARKLVWHAGLGREIGYVFWAMIGVEAAYGAYGGIWPLWIASLGAPVTIVGLLMSSTGILRLFFLLPSAGLGERFDPRKLIIAARSLTFIGIITAGLAQHWTQLLVMIVLSSAGEIAFPLTQTYLAKRTGENRLRAFTLVFNIGPAVAFAIIPVISGVLIAFFDLRAAFFLAAASNLFSLFFFVRFSPEPPKPVDHVQTKSTYRDAFRLPGVPLLLIAQGVTIFTLSLGISLLPNFLADQRGFPAAFVAVMAGIGSAGSVLFGVTVTRSRKLQTAPLFAVAIAVGLVMVTLSVSLASHLLWLIGLAFLGRGGLWSAWGLFIAALGEIVQVDRLRGRVFTMSEMIAGTCFASAPVISGLLYARNPAAPLVASMVCAAVLIPVLLLLQRNVLPGLAPRAYEEPLASVAPELI